MTQEAIFPKQPFFRWLPSAILERAIGVFIRTLAVLPKSWLEAIARALTAMLRFGLKKEYQKVSTNLHKIYKLPPHSFFAKRFGEQVIRNQLIIGLEALVSSYRPARVRLRGLNRLRELIRENQAPNKGFIVITGHNGSWELVAYAAALAAEKRFTALAKPSKSTAVTRVLHASRGRMHTDIIWTGSSNLMRLMQKIILSGGPLGFVMDQKPTKKVGVTVDFMGLPTPFVVGPALLAARTGAAVIGIFCVREGPFQYRVISRELLKIDHSNKDIVNITQILAKEIEKIIKLYPEQWLWNYRRWRFEG